MRLLRVPPLCSAVSGVLFATALAGCATVVDDLRVDPDMEKPLVTEPGPCPSLEGTYANAGKRLSATGGLAQVTELMALVGKVVPSPEEETPAKPVERPPTQVRFERADEGWMLNGSTPLKSFSVPSRAGVHSDMGDIACSQERFLVRRHVSGTVAGEVSVETTSILVLRATPQGIHATFWEREVSQAWFFPPRSFIETATFFFERL